MKTIDQATLRDLVRATYVANGVPDAAAGIVAGLQVEANLVGHDSHGVSNTKKYVDEIHLGHIVPDAQMEIVQEGPGTLVIDGHWGFGYTITSEVLPLIAEKARTHGVCAAIIRRQGHVGRLGAYTTRLAEQSLIGIMTADSGAAPKAVAPHGGRERKLGTNPISIAVPAQNTISCLDMATSGTAVGKLMIARLRGELLADDLLIDAEGRPTNDPEDFFRGGALLPMGGNQAHKGSGLSFMVEVLSGILTGIGFGVDPKGRHNDGCFLLAVDVNAFKPLGEFLIEMQEFIDWIKDSELADGSTEVLYPGEIEQRVRASREDSGIPVDDSVYDYLQRAAAAAGSPQPAQ